MTREGVQPTYSWETRQLTDGAQLVILFCQRPVGGSDVDPESVPLLAVLRDTLGDNLRANDRLSYVWLLSYGRPGWKRKAFASLPFNFWRFHAPASKSAAPNAAPLLDLTALQRPIRTELMRNIVQWSALDSSYMPLRAGSRTYRANEYDDGRLHLQQAISYLNNAGADSDNGLSSEEMRLLASRLELRKSFLGGFVNEGNASRLGDKSAVISEEIRLRNWELLRQWSEKVGLDFESLNLTGSRGEYAVLWARVGPEPRSDLHRKQIWKLLGVHNPYRGDKLLVEEATSYTRNLDSDGRLLPAGESGTAEIRLVPVGVYNLLYPRHPLLLVDFANEKKLRRREMLQRSVNELTAGIIGISHFTNWYYYAGSASYSFVASRHGTAMNQSSRLDAYAQFRAAVALDVHLDEGLRHDLQSRASSLGVNPLEVPADEELQSTAARFRSLLRDADEGRLAKRLDRSRRAELAADLASRRSAVRDQALNFLSLGIYTHRSARDPENLRQIDVYRQVQAQLSFLKDVTANRTEPEVSFDSSLITESLTNLNDLLPEVRSKHLRQSSREALHQVQQLSHNGAIQSQCNLALATLDAPQLAASSPTISKPNTGGVPQRSGSAVSAAVVASGLE